MFYKVEFTQKFSVIYYHEFPLLRTSIPLYAQYIQNRSDFYYWKHLYIVKLFKKEKKSEVVPYEIVFFFKLFFKLGQTFKKIFFISVINEVIR